MVQRGRKREVDTKVGFGQLEDVKMSEGYKKWYWGVRKRCET